MNHIPGGTEQWGQVLQDNTCKNTFSERCDGIKTIQGIILTKKTKNKHDQ
jgi:hypothetical protein